MTYNPGPLVTCPCGTQHYIDPQAPSGAITSLCSVCAAQVAPAPAHCWCGRQDCDECGPRRSNGWRPTDKDKGAWL